MLDCGGGNRTLKEFEDAAALVQAVMAPTPQSCWSLLSARAEAEIWVKH